MPTATEGKPKPEEKSGRVGPAVHSFLLAGLALIAPFFISPFISPAFNTPTPSGWAIFCEYTLPAILWLIVLPAFVLTGIVQLVSGGRELTTYGKGSQPPVARTTSTHLADSLYMMGVMNLVFGIPFVLLGIYEGASLLQFNSSERWGSIISAAVFKVAFQSLWIVVGLGAIRGHLWSRWCGMWLVSPTIVMLVTVFIVCLSNAFSKETSGIASVCMIAAAFVTPVFAFAYLVITLRSACTPPQSRSSSAAP